MNEKFKKYLSHAKNIKGPMRIECAYLISAVLQAQSQLKGFGNIMEIGVLQGRSTLPAACYLNEGELFYAIDPFENIQNDSTLIYGGVGNYGNFINNWEQVIGNSSQLKVIKYNSEEFFQNLKKSKQNLHNQFKYLSIDGNHSYEGTLSDLRNSKPPLNDKGILTIDDVFNIEWPSVSQALNTFLESNKDLVPFCAGWGRLFICKASFVKPIQNQTRNTFESFTGDIKKNLRILTSFKFYGNEIDIYTNRYGSASRIELDPKAYKVGLIFQNFMNKFKRL